MHSRVVMILLILLFFGVGSPSAATISLTKNDTALLGDLQNQGIPLFYQIPQSLKSAFSEGKEGSMASVVKKQSEDLDTFDAKISAYTLSPSVQVLRDEYLRSAEIVRNDLRRSATLSPSCGSCIATMNDLYPDMRKLAEENTDRLLLFYQGNNLSLDAYLKSPVVDIQRSTSPALLHPSGQ